MVFIILLFFSYEPGEISVKYLYVFLYGLLLGILVSSISYFGIEYFLLKQPDKECTDLNECVLKEMPPPIEETPINLSPVIVDANIKTKISKFNVSPLKTICIILIILISIFLIYFYFKK